MSEERTRYRIALANLPFPASLEDAVAQASRAVLEAGAARADIIAFPEEYLPGYRLGSHRVAPADEAALERAWDAVAQAARQARVHVVLGTERFVAGKLRITNLVLDREGRRVGFQDKVQLDPSEDATFEPGSERHVFDADGLRFGIATCHEGWRYPETVRWAAKRGAHVVFHPHFHEAEPGSFRPAAFADPANTFHEKALLCRAAENTCYVASVNCASPGSPTTSAVVRPDGTLQCHQPYGKAGLLLADIDTTLATGLLAGRLRTSP